VSTPAVDPAAIAGTLATNVGGQVLTTAETLAPIAVPFILAMTAIGWALNKFGLRKKASLSSGVK
jgi:hypothetical protein